MGENSEDDAAQNSISDPEVDGETDAPDSVTVRVIGRLADIPADEWDACANPPEAIYNPFVSHTFLNILEESGSVGPKKGWLPTHLVMQEPGGSITAAMPCYMKSNSQGEFVFDHAWADAYHRAGGSYYPKLVCAVPFTPVPGPRILVRPTTDEAPIDRHLLMTSAVANLARRQQVSSIHINFTDEAEWTRLGRMGYLQRQDQQFHFHNPGYQTFEDFLATLASRKRKAVRKEREAARDGGSIQIEWITGSDLTEAHWDAFYDFYQDTSSRKWGRPYLNRKAFSLLGERMPDQCLLIMAKRDDRYIAGAMNMIGGDCLFGRYWGSTEHQPCLHFEICYYQAIEYAIAHNLPRVEAGAQGEHKLARGYVPTTTYSAHWIADPGLRQAVERYLVGERRYVEETREILTDYTPYRKSDPEPCGPATKSKSND